MKERVRKIGKENTIPSLKLLKIKFYWSFNKWKKIKKSKGKTSKTWTCKL